MIRKRNLAQTLDRCQAYVERHMGNGILARIRTVGPHAEGEPEQAHVRECLLIENPDHCVELDRVGIRKYDDGVSDMYPSVYPTFYFGESVWSGMLGAPIVFSGTSSHTWSHCAEPPIRDWASFDYPLITSDNRWLKEMLRASRYFVEQLGPVCDYTPFIFMDCLNLLVELRGATTAYLDLYDHPAEVSKFMEWSVNVNMGVFDAQAAILRQTAEAAFGGHPYARYSSTRLPSLSVDAYGLCEPGVYERLGLEYHRRIVAHYGGGQLHIHGNGRHLCEVVAQNSGLTSCSMGDDIGFPPAWTLVDELKRRLAPVPIAVSIPYELFIRGLDERTLPAGVLYSTENAAGEDVEKLMARVLEYRAK